MNNQVELRINYKLLFTWRIALAFIWIRAYWFRWVTHGRNFDLDVKMVHKSFRYRGEQWIIVYWIKAYLK